MLPLDETQLRTILLDIEGTTTPAYFVYKTLFPYARKHAQEFLLRHRGERDICANIEDLRKQHEADAAQELEPPPWRDDSPDSRLASVVAYVHWLMGRDSKCPPLKSLQGKIWQEGYDRGELRGEVFPDVPRAFARWSEKKKGICIFSSGSVPAQKLLFASTTAEDLTKFIHAFFDTGMGTKTDPRSYERIAASLGLSGPEILFISDILKELDAACRAGMRTALRVRGSDPESAADSHLLIHSFDEVFP